MVETVTIGQTIRVARKAAGMSIRELADRIGVSGPYIHDLEHDRRRLSSERWQMLVEALPTMTMRALADAYLSTGAIVIDATEFTDSQRASLAEAIVAALRGEVAHV